jgi:hypothetical protein
MNLTISLSPDTLKRLLVLIVTAGGVVTASLAYADLEYAFNGGEKLTAKALDGNFKSLDGRVGALQTGHSALEKRVAAIEAMRGMPPVILDQAGEGYSVGGTYQVRTEPVSGAITLGTLKGYRAANLKCKKTAASDSAHMCSSEEVVRSRQRGKEVESGWYTTGAYVLLQDPGLEALNDCGGWIVGTDNVNGAYWTGSGGLWLSCDKPTPILCCD